MAREGIQIGNQFLTPDQFRAFVGFNHFMLEEAIASVALDNDPRAQTVCIDELTPEQLAEWERSKRESTRDGDPQTD